jgi:hypothetical protein
LVNLDEGRMTDSDVIYPKKTDTLQFWKWNTNLLLWRQILAQVSHISTSSVKFLIIKWVKFWQQKCIASLSNILM